MDPFYDVPPIFADAWASSFLDMSFQDQVQMFHDSRDGDVRDIIYKYLWGPPADSDQDGVPDYRDYMNGYPDSNGHHHLSDGTVMARNEDGTWTQFDENGTRLGNFRQGDVGDDTGSSNTLDGSRTGGSLSHSSDGTTYVWHPI